MRQEYNSKIIGSSRELTAKERIQLKDTSNAIKLDEALDEVDKIAIDIDLYAFISVHNEKAKTDNKEYEKIVLLDKAGQKYVTGSESFKNALVDIAEELESDGITDFAIEAYKLASKNYAGKKFITCSLA